MDFSDYLSDEARYLGFDEPHVFQAALGTINDGEGDRMIYQKLDRPLVVTPPNGEPFELEVYFKSAEWDDADRLLSYLLPDIED